MFTLPPPVQPDLVLTNVQQTAPIVVVQPDQPAALNLSEADLMQRISNAVHLLGIDPDIVKAHLVVQLEAAAAAYVNAKVGNDKSLFQAQGVRLLAAIHAMFTAEDAAPEPAATTE